MIKLFLVVLLALGIECGWGKSEVQRLFLPETIYAVPGIEANVYFYNIFLTINPDNYAFWVNDRTQVKVFRKSKAPDCSRQMGDVFYCWFKSKVEGER